MLSEMFDKNLDFGSLSFHLYDGVEKHWFILPVGGYYHAVYRVLLAQTQ